MTQYIRLWPRSAPRKRRAGAAICYHLAMEDSNPDFLPEKPDVVEPEVLPPGSFRSPSDGERGPDGTRVRTRSIGFSGITAVIMAVLAVPLALILFGGLIVFLVILALVIFVPLFFSGLFRKNKSRTVIRAFRFRPPGGNGL